MSFRFITYALLILVLAGTTSARADSFEFGFAQADITPTEPLRLSGYGSRTEPFTGIDESLNVRAMALRCEGGKPHVLVSIDTIGLPGSLVESIAKKAQQQFRLARPQLVFCFTHTHTAPHIAGGLTNIFAKPLTKAERTGAERYTQRLATQTLTCVGQAIDNLAPGTLHYGVGNVRFAQNRRLLRDGKWVGFGVNPDGPVDHTLPLLKILDPDGNVRGFVFDYACHCTTFGGDHNQVNGDWAGYATQYLEQAFPGACALAVIGCGADANPPRDRNRAMEFAKAEAIEIRDEVKRLAATPMQPITEPLAASFSHCDLPFVRPAVEELKQQLQSSSAQTRTHAQNMLALREQDGQLPATYSAPIQVWKFGDQLAMVFLSGEVVVDYALRLKKEEAPRALWVTAYSNDLFAYVASERMRAEGGYEYDHSMIYYNQPGPWESGTEDLLIRHIRRQLAQ